MRTLGYFFDSPAAPSLNGQQGAYEQYCQAGAHRSYETFTDDLATPGERLEFQRLLSYIKESGNAFLVLVSGPECVGEDLHSVVERVLAVDALGSELRSLSADRPDVIKAAVRASEGERRAPPRTERIREALRAKAVRGEGLGKPPYGYHIGNDGRLAPAPSERDIVHQIYDWYVLEGVGIRIITGRLNERGLWARSGAPWNMVTIRDILRNRAYIGTYTRFGIRVPRNHPPLVDNETFRRAQERMLARQPRRGVRRAEAPFLLSGLAHCSACSSLMIGVTRRRAWKRKDGSQQSVAYRYYQCQSRANRSTCSYNTRRAADLEEAVRIEATNLVAADSAFSVTIEREALDGKQMREAGRRFHEQVWQYDRGTLGLRGVRAALEDLQRARSASAATAASSVDGTLDRQAVLESLGPGWESIDAAAKRRLLQALVERVNLPAGGGAVVRLRGGEGKR